MAALAALFLGVMPDENGWGGNWENATKAHGLVALGYIAVIALSLLLAKALGLRL